MEDTKDTRKQKIKAYRDLEKFALEIEEIVLNEKKMKSVSFNNIQNKYNPISDKIRYLFSEECEQIKNLRERVVNAYRKIENYKVGYC